GAARELGVRPPVPDSGSARLRRRDGRRMGGGARRAGLAAPARVRAGRDVRGRLVRARRPQARVRAREPARGSARARRHARGGACRGAGDRGRMGFGGRAARRAARPAGRLDGGLGVRARGGGRRARRDSCVMEATMNLLAVLENGLFALGQVLRFPVMALLWVCVAAALFMAGAAAMDWLARRRERQGFDVERWLKAGSVLDADAAREA